MQRGNTTYSRTLPSNSRNYKQFVRFDWTDGYLGITQFDGDTNKVKDRVLLSPQQTKSLLSFVNEKQ